MPRTLARLFIMVAAGLFAIGPAATPAVAGQRHRPVAYLDGKTIPVADVSRYHCDDFEYPVIRCSQSPLATESRATAVALAGSADYVTIYDGSAFTGGSMTLSQDYSSLISIGWNDKVSSYRGRNSATGKFWTDWFYSAKYDWFCCNEQVQSLGSLDNTFSSVERT